MRGYVGHRGDERGGSWEYIVDVATAPAQKCTVCNKRIWIERRPIASCPRGGALQETEDLRRETKAGFATEKECQATMNEILVAVEEHNYTAPTKASVKDCLTKGWLPAVKSTIRPTTYPSYAQHVECHIMPHIGTAKLQTWDKQLLWAFLGAVADERLSPLRHTLAFTEMRRGEALGLRWQDVDLENARLSVRRALIPINRDVVVSEPKTAKGRRVIALDPGTIEVLKAPAARHLDEQTT